MTKRIMNVKIASALAGAMLTLISPGCSAIMEDMEECPSGLRVSFVYDYHLKWSDAFAREVESVNVWAFDATGKLVWSGEDSGEALKADGYSILTPLGTGTYDFVAWCGLKDHPEFNLSTYTPTSKEELEMELRTLTEADGTISSSVRLPGLFHGKVEGVRHTDDPYSPSETRVVIPLMKDTKDIRVMLQHLDGTSMSPSDFTASIIYSNSRMHWDNSLHADAPETWYRPWNIRYGQIGEGEPTDATKAMTSVSTLVFELSTGRLMEGPDAVLNIRRNTDGVNIIRIPLVDYLLLVRGHYGDIGDQEYLDRQDDYSMTFFIDENNNWYKAYGIYINSWAVVPPQDEDI